jgi:hypothetical protein
VQDTAAKPAGKAIKANQKKPKPVDPVAHLVGGYGPHLFSGQLEEHDRYEFIDGALVYEEADSKTHTHGFHPASSREIEGNRYRRIYDYPSRATAEGVAASIHGQLARKDYKVLFSCEGVVCGEAAGWRLFLTPLAVGVTANQYYVAAMRSDAKLGDQYFAAYVNEVDDRPRVIVDYVGHLK